MAASTYAEVSLGDIADFRNGKSLSPEQYSPEGRNPVFGSNGQIARTDEVLYQTPVIAIGRVGAYCGSVHYIPEASWVTDNAIAAAPKAGSDLRFLYYLLRSLQLRRTAIGSAQPLMTQGGLKAVRTVAPPLPQQKAIAEVLGALDDKIELNRRINATLEAMARALFQSWFVDFDPVRAKAEGRPPSGLDEPSAALFPAQFQDSEIGEIPKGWRITTVEKVLELGYGKALPKSERKDGPFPVYGSGGITGYHDTSLLDGPGIIVGRKGTVGSLYWEDAPFYPIDTVFFVKATSAYSLEFLYYLLGILGLTEMNTDAAVPGLNRNNVYRLEVIKCPEKIASKFTEIVHPFHTLMRKNSDESAVLSQMRDSLLPKLLSGEIACSDFGRSGPKAGK